ncbi:hypothetical protein C2845_PM09G17660 [Panicum miliaceum]|uniref:Peptidyl-prolyl cis-trans isomerase n=1 Tax=Panicum miliaceum TaxID=4540 RepID=A0A3L6RYX0_PANMI|nr:hypothetical protein C2845_PM09G17660 [Panicum miliaceum]
MARKKNPFVFVDVLIGDGKMVFELFADVVPKTAENFRALCTGEKGVGKTTISPLYYRGTRFHKIMKGLIAQGGDFSKNNGTGGESIYGGTFEDENFVLCHDDRGLLSMANTGPNTNGSQFFITFKPAPHLDRKNTVFGKLILGDDVLKKIECVDVDGLTPLVRVKIVNCGMQPIKAPIITDGTEALPLEEHHLGAVAEGCHASLFITAARQEFQYVQNSSVAHLSPSAE